MTRYDWSRHSDSPQQISSCPANGALKLEKSAFYAVKRSVPYPFSNAGQIHHFRVGTAIRVSVDKPAWLLGCWHKDRCAGVDGSRRCVRTRLGRCVRALRNWSATSWRPHLKDAIDVSKPDMNFAMRSSAWRVSRNASPKYRRNIGVSGSFAALNACSRTSSLCCDQIDPQRLRNGRRFRQGANGWPQHQVQPALQSCTRIPKAYLCARVPPVVTLLVDRSRVVRGGHCERRNHSEKRCTGRAF